jgi:hypothetical protein
MKYTIINNQSLEVECDKFSELENFLSQSYEYWNSGSGDSAIQINNDERLIFFKIKDGVFIMQSPDYLVPIAKNINKNQKSDTLIHYVGGEKFKFPKSIVYDFNVALKILKSYIEHQKSNSNIQWIDMYDINFDWDK